jgi:hypothetical protein
MNSFKSAAVIGLSILLAIVAFDRSQQDSMVRLMLTIPLFPGLTGGLLFSGHGGNVTAGYFSCWIIDTGLYWGLWILVSRIIWPRFRN